MSAYTRSIQYEFEAGGEEWAITHAYSKFGEFPCLFIKETRCNGQEDTHMMGDFVFLDGKWKAVEGECGSIVRYSDESVVEDIVDYLNDHNPIDEPWWADFLDEDDDA